MVCVIGHKNPDTDSICSAIVMAYFLDGTPGRQGELNPETKYVLEKFGVPEPQYVDSAKGREIVLVDHAEPKQTLDDLEEGELVCIIDHHKNGLTTSKPILHIAKPLGSTATVIAEFYFNNGMHLLGAKNKELTPQMAGLLLSAILSDTVLFRSPTTTELDKEMAEKLAKIAGIEDIEAFGKELLKAKAVIAREPPEKMLTADYKEFDFNGRKVGIGQIEIVDLSEVEPKIDDLLRIMKEKQEKEGYELIVFAITDVLNKGSKVLVVGNREAFEKAFNTKLDEKGIAYLKGVMSRKKQLVPPLDEYFKGQ